ncbi:hypothetical protein Pint_11965 [Pistacia integerrima]|uniref:Uncharacterized protein n=1 Tax=Pistacia integerrima TaxID=434235 RepID=A0ACC0XJ56_9ROSI|nr:hypothetical protein Pint_11965 [Pistacia integerrima]
MPAAKPQSSDAKIIAYVDMDCLDVQMEQRKQLHLRGLPSAVVQYNEWKDGDLIAISFEARKYGVKCLSTNELVQVPVARGKADLITFQNALWVQSPFFQGRVVVRGLLLIKCISILLMLQSYASRNSSRVVGSGR